MDGYKKRYKTKQQEIWGLWAQSLSQGNWPKRVWIVLLQKKEQVLSSSVRIRTSGPPYDSVEEKAITIQDLEDQIKM